MCIRDMPKYARLVYNGYWFAPERVMMQKAIDATQKRVNGQVRLALYKGNVIVIGRQSPNSLYDEDLATFESSNYDQRDAEGFIKLNALRLKKNRIQSGFFIAEGEKIIDSNHAFQLTWMLKGVTTRGTARSLNKLDLSIAGKTTFKYNLLIKSPFLDKVDVNLLPNDGVVLNVCSS